MSLHIYDLQYTGELESWGAGIQDPSKVRMYDGFVQLREGVEVSELENPTITLTEITDPDDVAMLTEKYNLVYPPVFFEDV